MEGVTGKSCPGSGETDRTKLLHSLPCRIHHTGPAPVSTYFKVEELEKGNKAATFRGRLLHGQELTPPESYCIYVSKGGLDGKHG